MVKKGLKTEVHLGILPRIGIAESPQHDLRHQDHAKKVRKHQLNLPATCSDSILAKDLYARGPA